MENVTLLKKTINIHQEGNFYSSPTRLDIILTNLLSNAIKYADLKKEQPYIEIDIQCSILETQIRVRDNGEGIPDNALTKIFDMFYRASEKGTGSGLGLYIVKEAIQKLGGTIQVSSEQGKGTVFDVRIPNLFPDAEA